MKNLTKDILYCARLALYIFIGTFAVGLLIGFMQNRSNINEVLLWGARLSLLIAVLGLGIAGMSFIKVDTMRPLEYQRQWEEYFGVMNLTHVILTISICMAAYAFACDYVVRVFV